MKSDDRELSNSEKGMLVRSMDEYAFYKEMFSQLIDIVDALLTQLTEKVSVLPYNVRQFCKCLYQMTFEKFGKKEVGFEKAIQIVAHYLLEQWLLKACLEDLHLEGLTKEFYLGPYCKKNLLLAKQILFAIMTFQQWEVPTPQSERLPGETDLFTMPSSKKAALRSQVKNYYRDLL